MTQVPLGRAPASSRQGRRPLHSSSILTFCPSTTFPATSLLQLLRHSVDGSAVCICLLVTVCICICSSLLCGCGPTRCEAPPSRVFVLNTATSCSMAGPSRERDAASLPTPTAKKTTSTLLPAFEPLSSSPALPRPLKRTRDALEDRPTYPTPVPTSSTAIQSSPPTRAQAPHPTTTRTFSAFSERAPLVSVPSLELAVDGHPIRLGRSSASCDLQLSSNRLISRVHVVAKYKAAVHSMDVDRVELQCVGWNAITVHCGGKPYELKKGETFTTDLRDSEILLDVHGSRVRIHWPEKPHLGPTSSDEEEGSPTKRQRSLLRHSTPPSPSPAQTRRQQPVSPISPSPAVQALLPSSPPLPAVDELAATEALVPSVEIYEDPEPGDENVPPSGTVDPSQANTHILSQNLNASMRSQDLLASPNADFSDNDEENDPIVHSFGPFGENLLPRMASFNTNSSPIRKASQKTPKMPHTDPLQPPHISVQSEEFDIKEHVVNQLAFSRLSSTPLSTILSNLPRDAGFLTKASLKDVIDNMDCVGEVVREGKDAAGKTLESEYYYLPEKDQDEKRKELVSNDLMKPGLRACRKQHKVRHGATAQPTRY